MENIKFQSKYQYNIEYLPTRRSRKHRKQTMETTADFEVKDLLSIEAPVAFKIHDFAPEYAEASGIIDSAPEGMYYATYPIRFYQGKYYKEYIDQNVDEHTFSFIDKPKNIAKELKRLTYRFMNMPVAKCFYPDIPFNPKKSLGFSDLPEYENKERRKDEIQRQINQRFIVVENRLYVETSVLDSGEPRYTIYTLGLGHNHGGTSLSIDFSYNENISNNRYFRADDYENAVSAAIEIAQNRGDTKYIDRIKDDYKTRKSNYIEIMDPSAVQLHPQDEAGDGDPFMNEIESLINGSPDTLTAGLGVIAKTVKHLDKN